MSEKLYKRISDEELKEFVPMGVKKRKTTSLWYVLDTFLNDDDTEIAEISLEDIKKPEGKMTTLGAFNISFGRWYNRKNTKELMRQKGIEEVVKFVSKDGERIALRKIK